MTQKVICDTPLYRHAVLHYCRTRFDGDCLTAVKIAAKFIAIVRTHYGNYTHHTLYRSCLLIYGIAIDRSLSFLFLDSFERNTSSCRYQIRFFIISLYCSVFTCMILLHCIIVICIILHFIVFSHLDPTQLIQTRLPHLF